MAKKNAFECDGCGARVEVAANTVPGTATAPWLTIPIVVRVGNERGAGTPRGVVHLCPACDAPKNAAEVFRRAVGAARAAFKMTDRNGGVIGSALLRGGCEACAGHVAPGKRCFACGRAGPM